MAAPLKSKKNLTRFTYETSGFQGWRVTLARHGTSFTAYFSDKKLGGGKKSMIAAEQALIELKAIIDNSKLVNGRLSSATVKKAQKLLDERKLPSGV